MPSKLEQLKKEIQRLRSEIMELKRNCKYELDKRYIHVLDRDKYDYSCDCMNNKLSGQAFTNYKCKSCHNEFSHCNTGVPSYCKKCAIEKKKCQYCGKSLVSLGRPITLEDVLAVMVEKDWVKNSTVLEIMEKWLLGKPLDDQSEETINLLHSLIVN